MAERERQARGPGCVHPENPEQRDPSCRLQVSQWVSGLCGWSGDGGREGLYAVIPGATWSLTTLSSFSSVLLGQGPSPHEEPARGGRDRN